MNDFDDFLKKKDRESLCFICRRGLKEEEATKYKGEFVHRHCKNTMNEFEYGS